jgi:cell division septum initiation protein DivIVA
MNQVRVGTRENFSHNDGVEKPLPVPPFQFPATGIPKRPRGYDRAATERVFASLAASYEKLWNEREKLLARMAELEAELGRMREQEPLLRDVLLEAQRSARSTIEEARSEAEALLEKARREAEEIRKIVHMTETDLMSFLRDAIERAQPNGTDPAAYDEVLDDEGLDDEARSVRA